MFLGLALPLKAAEPVPPELNQVGINEKFGDQISLDLEFMDESGEKVNLAKFFDGKRPVILNLVYYECPMLCTFVLNGLLDGLKKMEWSVGENFQVVTISIDPKESTRLAVNKKKNYLSKYGREDADKSWHFLTSPDDKVKQLAQELGFNYRYDERQDEYAHASALFILTPEGKASRYLYGIEYPAKDMKLALLEASEGKIGTLIDKFVLFCYHYDPQGKRYALLATNLMKVAGGITIAAIIILIVILGLKNRQGGKHERVHAI